MYQPGSMKKKFGIFDRSARTGCGKIQSICRVRYLKRMSFRAGMAGFYSHNEFAGDLPGAASFFSYVHSCTLGRSKGRWHNGFAASYSTSGFRRVGRALGYSVRPSERRKGYAKEMLRQNLENARRMGIKRVLITCVEENVASEKTIVANGGVFDHWWNRPMVGFLNGSGFGWHPLRARSYKCKK